MTAPVSQVLSEAADNCEVSGKWCQNFSQMDQFGRDARETQCVVVARSMNNHFSACCTESEQYNEGFKLLAQVCDGTPYRFNDTPGRTAGECAAKLREAAALAKEQGR